MKEAGLVVVGEADLDRLIRVEVDARRAGLLNEHGEVRKVLGTLPLTADGCVLGFGAAVFYPLAIGVGTAQHGPYFPWGPLAECYSTREAAEAARKEA